MNKIVEEIRNLFAAYVQLEKVVRFEQAANALHSPSVADALMGISNSKTALFGAIFEQGKEYFLTKIFGGGK